MAGKVGVPVAPRFMVYGKIGLAILRSDVSLQYDQVNVSVDKVLDH